VDERPESARDQRLGPAPTTQGLVRKSDWFSRRATNPEAASAPAAASTSGRTLQRCRHEGRSGLAVVIAGLDGPVGGPHEAELDDGARPEPAIAARCNRAQAVSSCVPR
jgi:hypothetical protein